jgi:hypothetical protein
MDMAGRICAVSCYIVTYCLKNSFVIYAVLVLVEQALHCKPEGRGFETRRNEYPEFT